MKFNSCAKGHYFPPLVNKILLVMKLTALLLTVACLQLSAKGYSQNINLSGKNILIEDVFKSIEAQSGYFFLYKYNEIKNAKPITIDLKNAKLGNALKQTFDGQPFTFSIKDMTIVVSKKNEALLSEKDKLVIKQNIEISGIITDSLKMTLPGVSVYVKNNSKIGTTSDLNGRYILSVPQDATLIFSMVGFKTQEINVSDKKTINVVLKQNDLSIDEVVITGFGARVRRTDMIGAVTSVKPTDLKVPSSNLTTALAGRMAGMIAYQRSGEPGLDNADFFIRGVTTFGYKVDPLILIDNVEVTTTDLARLQVDDLASFSILKDATATAIYGARGANGVILVTTKTGVEGRTKLAFRLENSLSTSTRNIELADPITYMRLSNESRLTRDVNVPLLYPIEKIEKTAAGGDPYLYPAVDWREVLIKDYTFNQRANLNVSGGGKVAQFFVSGAFNQDNGILKVPSENNFNNNIDLKSYSLRANVNMNLTKSTEFIVRLNGSFDDYSGPISGGQATFNNIMRTSPTLFAPYYPAGEDQQFIKHIMFGNAEGGNYSNPYADLVKGYKNYSRSMMFAQVELKQDLSFLTEGFSFRSLVNTTRNSYFDVTRQYQPFYYQIGGVDPTTNQYTLQVLNENSGTEFLDYKEGGKTVGTVFYMENVFNYNRTFLDKHNLGGLLVSILRNRLSGNAGNLQESLPFRNLGVSGRFTYGYDSRYHLEFNFGYNGSERFHESKRYGFFPSAGVAWSVSNEKFWESIKPILSNFRVRGTYGVVGNDAIGSASDRFLYLSEVNMQNSSRGATFGSERSYSRNGISMSRYANPEITWEKGYKSNLGLELGLYSKVQIMADLFREKRTNIFMERADIPSSMGLGADINANLGEAESSGFEFSIDYNHTASNSFWFQSRANFTYATSKFRIYEEPVYKEPWLSRVGHSLSQQWGYIAERLFVDDEEVANSPKQVFGSVLIKGGDVKFRDVNGDGQISAMDRVPIGYPTTPEIIYGFGFSTGFKRFDLSAFFQGSARSSFWIDPNATAPFVNNKQLLQVYADSYWSEDNRNVYALWPRLSSQNVANNQERSTWFMRDGTFLRLKQLELGYTFSPDLTKRVGMNNFRLYANGANLFSFSKFKLWDVEMAGNGLGYPLQQVFNLGINASF